MTAEYFSDMYTQRWWNEFCLDVGAAEFALATVSYLSNDNRWTTIDVPPVSRLDTPSLWVHRQKTNKELHQLAMRNPKVLEGIRWLAEQYLELAESYGQNE